jgi:hypothetical protein
MGEKDSDFEIIEPENYSAGKMEFSNGELVMMSFRKCIELGAKEMREGYYNTKMDKGGNTNYIYVPDTRKEFIEAVETLLMIMADDIDDDFESKISEVQSSLSKIYDGLCSNEKDIWENASFMMKQQWNSKNIFYREKMLSGALPFATDYLIEKVSAYRKIVGIMKKRIKELNYYKEEEFHG